MLAPLALGFPPVLDSERPPAEYRFVEESTQANGTATRAVALGRALLIQEAGTGGIARIRLDDQTSTRTPVLGSVLGDVDFTNPADLVAFARAYLSLSLSDFARAVGVERPTIYAWLNGNAVPSEASWRRLMAMG